MLLHLTTVARAPEIKLAPLTVSVKACVPAATELGLRLATVGSDELAASVEPDETALTTLVAECEEGTVDAGFDPLAISTEEVSIVADESGVAVESGLGPMTAGSC